MEWMFHSRKLNRRVYKLHERALRTVYQDYASPFTELLEKDNSTTLHNRNILLLTTALFKVKNGLLPLFMEHAQHYYDLRKKLKLRKIMLNSVQSNRNFNFCRT